RVRDRPHIARARWVSERMVSERPSASWVTSISSATVQELSPLGPLTETVWPSSVTVTPFGTAMVFLPIRDISVDPAEDCAADVSVAGVGVRHDAFRSREDRDAEAVLDRLQIADGRIDATAGLRHAGDLSDHRLAVEVLQLNLELRELAGVLNQRIAADVALVLQHVQDALAQAGSRGEHRRTLAGGRVLEASDHVAQVIVDHHVCSLPLPARLRQAGDLTHVAQLAQGHTAHLELAVVSPRTTRHFATVAKAARSRVARQSRQLQ